MTGKLVADLDETTYYRTFNLPGFGIVNCDKPFQFPQGTGIAADFVAQTEDGLRRFKSIQLIELDSPAYVGYMSGEYDDFRYRPRKENLIVGADQDGNIAVGLPSMFDGLKVEKGQTHIFELQWIKGEFDSLDELRAAVDELTQDYAL